jgi:predicted ArsR family transcriptional regulator
MTDVQLGPTSQKILEVLRRNRGTPHTADDICEVVDCTGSQAQTSLDALAHQGLVERHENALGLTTYVAR